MRYLGKFYCETDAAWETFCRFPNDETWKLCVAAKKAEDEAVRQHEMEKAEIGAKGEQVNGIDNVG